MAQKRSMSDKAPTLSWQKGLLLFGAVILAAVVIVEICRWLFGGGQWLSWSALGAAVLVYIIYLGIRVVGKREDHKP